MGRKPGSVPGSVALPGWCSFVCAAIPGTGRATPRRTTEAERRVPVLPCSEWGLPCDPCHQEPGALLPHPFTLTDLDQPKPAVCFLWHFPAGHPDCHFASTLPCGARTFLDTQPDGPCREHLIHSTVHLPAESDSTFSSLIDLLVAPLCLIVCLIVRLNPWLNMSRRRFGSVLLATLCGLLTFSPRRAPATVEEAARSTAAPRQVPRPRRGRVAFPRLQRDVGGVEHLHPDRQTQGRG